MERHESTVRTLTALVATAALTGCGGGGDAGPYGESAPNSTTASTSTEAPTASPLATLTSKELKEQARKARTESEQADILRLLKGRDEQGWLQLAGGIPAPVVSWNADSPGAYVASVKAAIANPPAGTSHKAHDELAAKYPQVLRALRAQGIGASTLGTAHVDDFANNSFNIIRYPEESIDDTTEHTYHKYGSLTYVGQVDASRGISKDWLADEVLIKRFPYPTWTLTAMAASFQASSVAYAISPVLAADPANFKQPAFYVTRIGVIDQVRESDGVVNITTTDHTVYPGTTRRTVVEFEGGLYIYTTGSGVNRYNNSGHGLIPFKLALTLLRETYQSGYAFGNDNYGPPAFQSLDQQAVQFINGVRGVAL